MALRQADRLESNNPKAYGIAKATQISGHRAVTTLNNLYSIPDCILSDSRTNQDDDAIGQEWYVISERCKYILIDWTERRNEGGWKKYVGTELGNILAGDRIQIEKDVENDTVTISADTEIDDTLNSASDMTWSIDKLKDVMDGQGINLVEKEENTLKLSVNVDNESIGVDSEDNTISVTTIDGGLY